MARNDALWFRCTFTDQGDGRRGVRLEAVERPDPSPPTLVYAFPRRYVIAFVIVNYPENTVNGLESNASFHKTVEAMLVKALDEMGRMPGGDYGQLSTNRRPL